MCKALKPKLLGVHTMQMIVSVFKKLSVWKVMKKVSLLVLSLFTLGRNGRYYLRGNLGREAGTDSCPSSPSTTIKSIIRSLSILEENYTSSLERFSQGEKSSSSFCFLTTSLQNLGANPGLYYLFATHFHKLCICSSLPQVVLK